MQKSLSENHFSFCDNKVTNGNVEFTIFGEDPKEAEVGQGRWAQGGRGGAGGGKGRQTARAEGKKRLKDKRKRMERRSPNYQTGV